MKIETQTYFEACNAINEQLEKMINSLHEQRKFLLAHDDASIEKSVKLQQAHMMKLNSLESARIKAQDSMGLSNKSVSEVLNLVNDDERKALLPVLDKMKQLFDSVKHLNKTSLNLVNSELNFFAQSSTEVKGGLYKNNGKKMNSGGNGYSLNGKI